MRILCSNDDGIHAPGMEVLERIAHSLSDDVWTIAPVLEQSGVARAITLHQPIRIQSFGEKRFGIQGTPTDSVMLGVTQLMKDNPPDLVLSGVNNGQNVAEDLTYSGTVAAALQGMMLEIPSIALSQSRFDRSQVQWATAEAHAPDILKKLLKAGWAKDVVMNINFPDCEPHEVKATEITAHGHRDVISMYTEERIDLRGQRYHWVGFRGRLSNPPEGTDLRAIYDGRISITPVHLALTHGATVEKLRDIF